MANLVVLDDPNERIIVEEKNIEFLANLFPNGEKRIIPTFYFSVTFDSVEIVRLASCHE